MSVNQETLMLFALDALDESESLSIAKKIKASAKLQAQLQDIQESLTPISQSVTPRPPSANVRQSLLDSIQSKTRFQGFLDRFSQLFDIETHYSQKLLDKLNNFTDSGWEKTAFPGVLILKFTGGSRVSAATCGIVYVESGKLFPAHQHQDKEEFLVLQGCAKDDKNQFIYTGDQFVFAKNSRHSFQAVSKEAFIFAVVLHKENKWLWIKTALDYLKLRS